MDGISQQKILVNMSEKIIHCIITTEYNLEKLDFNGKIFSGVQVEERKVMWHRFIFLQVFLEFPGILILYLKLPSINYIF